MIDINTFEKLKQIELFSKENNIIEIIKLYNEYIELSNDEEIFLSYCIFLHKNDMLNDCLKIINLGLIHNENSIKLLNFKGIILYQNNKLNDCFRIYNKLIQINGNDKLKYRHKYLNMKKYFGNQLKQLDQNNQRFKLQNELVSYDYKNELTNPNKYLEINHILHCVDVKMNKYKHDKIYIGLVSADFCNHVCSFFIKPLLKYYDKSKFEIVCFSNTKYKDETSEELYKLDNYWIDIFGIHPDIVRKQIMEMQIDVLIDLSGNGSGNRLDVFSKRCAPVQITYLGFPNTSGLNTIDYRICDFITDPMDTTQFFSEQLLRLDRCFICYERDIKFNLIDELDDNIINIAIVNKQIKYSIEFINCVKKIMNKLNCVIWIKKTDLIRGDNVKYIDYMDNEKYFEFFNKIDFCLDTFPYSGTTTTCDVLMTSTPVITYGIKNRHVSNVSSSILTHMGYNELVAYSEDEFINKAVELGKDKNRIRFYKKILMNKFFDCMNGDKFMREFENVINEIY